MGNFLFCNKITVETFSENFRHTFQILRKSSQNFIQTSFLFRTVEAPRSLKGMTMLDTFLEQFEGQIFHRDNI